MEEIKDIISLIKNPSAHIYKEWMDNMLEEYPYFSIPAILYLLRNKDHLPQDEYENILARVAISFPNRKKLYLILGEDACRFNDFYPEETEKKLDTFGTIDKFIGEYGGSENKEMDALSKLIFNPTPEYAQILAKEHQNETSDAPKSENDILLDKFIDGDQSSKAVEKNPPIVPEEVAPPPVPEPQPAKEEKKPVAKAPSPNDDSLLSESLAKIYIRQKKYDKALELIISLNEKYPNRSVYFADQIRFLKKLVLIQLHNAKNKGQQQ